MAFSSIAMLIGVYPGGKPPLWPTSARASAGKAKITLRQGARVVKKNW
jgi:hypothetical protein